MSEYTIYSAVTGAIRCVYQGQSPATQCGHDEAYVEGRYLDHLYRMDTQQVDPLPVEREAFGCTWSAPTIAPDGEDSAELSPIPAGTEARIQDATGTNAVVIDDAGLELTSNVPGDTIKVRLTHPHYLDATFTLGVDDES